MSDTEIADLLGRTSSAMLLADDSRQVVQANRPACEMLALDEDELIGMKIEDISAPELREAAPEMFRAFLEAGSQAGPFTLVRKTAPRSTAATRPRQTSLRACTSRSSFRSSRLTRSSIQPTLLWMVDGRSSP